MHGKIHASMYTGSMVGAGAMAFALMPYAIANARPDEGCTVDLNPIVLSAIFGEPKEKIESAIKFLCSPDKDSRSPEAEGRRLVHVGPGPYRYFVVNLEKYRHEASNHDRKEYWRQYRAWQRSTKKTPFKFDPNVHSEQVNSSILFNDVQRTDADADADAKKEPPTPLDKGDKRLRFQPPSLDEALLHGAKSGLPENEVRKFMAYYDSNGWRVSKNPMKNWHAAMAGWKTRWEERGRQINGHPVQRQMPLAANGQQNI